MKTKRYPFALRLVAAMMMMVAGLPLFAQTKINDGTVGGSSLPDNSAILELESSNKGLLLSRVSLTSTATWGLAGSTPVAGMIVYNTNASITSSSTSYPVITGGIGCYYWDGTGWVSVKMDIPKSIADTTYWTVKGNSATVGTTNFLGTTDNHPLVIKTDDSLSGYIDSSFGNGSTAFGFKTIRNNLSGAYTGTDNSAFGDYALQEITTGSQNTAVGNYALRNDLDGSWNSAFGQYALGSNTSGGLNTAMGQAALGSNVSGWSNTGVGQAALSANTWGSNNVAIGQSALRDNTSGGQNTAIGQNSMAIVTTGSNNVGVGNNVLGAASTTTASNNTGIGANALEYTYGNNNTGIGYQSIVNNTSGTDNVVIGYNTGGSITTGSSNIIIGSGLDAPSANASNSMNIGNTVYATNTNASTRKVGINTSAPNSTLQVSGSFSLPIATTTGSVTLDDTYYTLLVNNSGTATITLPSASSYPGRMYVIVHLTNKTCNTSTYYNFTNTATTSVGSNVSVTVQSNGTNWYQIH